MRRWETAWGKNQGGKPLGLERGARKSPFIDAVVFRIGMCLYKEAREYRRKGREEYFSSESVRRRNLPRMDFALFRSQKCPGFSGVSGGAGLGCIGGV